MALGRSPGDFAASILGLTMKRVHQRPAYLIAVLLAFLAGLTAHFAAPHLPHFVGAYVPDTLWALWVYLSIVLLAPRLPLLHAVGYALSFSYAVETSQLYHAPWLDAMRATLLGKLILAIPSPGAILGATRWASQSALGWTTCSKTGTGGALRTACFSV